MKFITLIVLASVCSHAGAQILYNNGAAISIKTACALQVNGSITTNAGSLENDGTIALKGNLINNIAMSSPYNGTLAFNGTVAQLVGGSNSFFAENVVINNPAGVTLNVPLKADAVVAFSNGLLTSSNTNPLIITANGSVSGATDASHVNGMVTKEGTGAFTYPVGNATNYQPIGINLTANSGGLSALYVPADAGTAPYGTGGTEAIPLLQYNTNEYWDLTPAGTATGTVTVYYDSYRASYLFSTADLRVAHKSGGMWLNEGRLSGVNGTTAGGNITSNTLSTWSPFTFGAISQVILPLSWLSFTGNLTAQKAASLQWQVQEHDVHHYDVEKSNEGRKFTSIGNISSKGNGRNIYQFVEGTALEGTAFYRIRQTDKNGLNTYSAVLKLSTTNTNGTLTVYPNPVKDFAIVSAPDQMLGHRLKLADAAGRVLQLFTIINPVLTIDMRPYGAGTYLLQTDDGTTSKIIKQ